MEEKEEVFRMTRILAEQIPNCYFLGKKARLRIYRNEKISVDPTGRQEYLASPSGWSLLNEYPCPINDGILSIPELELEPSDTRTNGLPTVVYMDAILDESGAERCSVLALHSLMSGHARVIEGYDKTGIRKPITLTKISFEKTKEFVSFARADGQVRYKPRPGVRLEFVKSVQCVKQGQSISLPPNDLGFEPDSNGKPTVIYILLETRDGKPNYLGTMHFEIDEAKPRTVQAFIYNDLGPREIMVKKDPIPDCGYLGKSAVLRSIERQSFLRIPLIRISTLVIPAVMSILKMLNARSRTERLTFPFLLLKLIEMSEENQRHSIQGC